MQKWNNPRLFYLHKFIKPVPVTCPECGTELTIDEEELYCNHCGLVCSSSIDYVAGFKIDLPYGVRL